MKRRLVFQILISLSIFSSAVAQTFSEEAIARGIDHQFESRGLMGGGCAFFDFDNDGDDDLYLNGGQKRDALYENIGGEFINISLQAGLESTLRNYTTAISVGDLDNDGYRDLFVTTWVDNAEAIATNLLFHNNGDGTFSDVSSQSNLDEKAFSIASNLFDFNNDGLLDIYVINHVSVPAFLYDSNGAIVGFDHECYENHLYINRGNMQFEEVGQSMNLASNGCTLAAMPSDYDDDGDLDLLLANDFGPFIVANQLFENNYPEPFTLTGNEVNANQGIYGMGIAQADFDRDGDKDYYVTNLGSNLLLKAVDGAFINEAITAGVDNEFANTSEFSTGWGTAFFDVDNDGWEDLFVANGRIPSLSTLPTATSDPDKLFLNNQDASFLDVSESANVSHQGYSRGMAYSDIDNDGDLDFFVMTINEFGDTGKLYINPGNDNHFVSLQLQGRRSNADAIGAKAFVYYNGESQQRELFAGGASFCSQHSSDLHIGLGSVSEVDSVVVQWPNSVYQTYTDISIDSKNVLVESFSTGLNKLNISENIQVSPNPFSELIYINIDQDLFSEPYFYSILDINGRELQEGEVPDPITEIQLKYPMPSGIYIVKVFAEKQIPVTQLLLKK